MNVSRLQPRLRNTKNSPSVSQPLLVNSVLSFIKAFRLKGDKDSLKRVVADSFHCSSVDSTKKDLLDCCSEELSAANLPFHAKWDSDKCSQLIANLDNIIEAFDVLDSSDLIPPIYLL